MATKTFGEVETPAPRDLQKELYDAVGAEFPVVLRTDRDGSLIGASYETTWKVGGTKAVETGDVDENNNPVIEYEEKYENKKLTADQIKKADAWLKDQIKAE